MAKTLRVGFAMGGGNSLGTFNGAALSQALKLLLLRGIDSQGEPYDRVEVDVFSGASAGSLSLALLLRGLVHPDPDRMMAAKVRLIAEFGAEFTKRPKETKKAIIAAQVLQDIQEEVWIHEVNMEKLLGHSSQEAKRRVRFSAGFLDRGAVEELAQRYLSFGPDGRNGASKPVTLEKRQILADRVLFANSIANLSPTIADASGEYPADDMGLRGLSDGMTSSVHSELRVFDLHFSEVEEGALLDPALFPRRWCRYHTGAKIRDTEGTGRGIGCLLEDRVWSKIAATSIASSAFPLAFEPVPLERRSYEFGETEGHGRSRWPQLLKGKDRHIFSYVDGGIFNNEPIREAFRLASYMDAQAPDEDFERLILFVDPHIVSPSPELGLPHHRQWLLDGPGPLLGSVEGVRLKRQTSLDRLLPLAGSLFNAITNESRVMEADKVFQTRDRFRIRNMIREELAVTLTNDPDPSSLSGLMEKLGGLLELDGTQEMIPTGASSLAGEIRRVVVEEGDQGNPLEALREKTTDEIVAFTADPASSPPEEWGAWLRALNYVAVDRVMKLEGKLERSQLVAISPATDPTDPGQMHELPGRRINGFGGFMSELAGEHEVEVARYCTQLFLQAAHRIREERLPKLPDFSKDRPRFLRDLRDGLEAVESRLVELMADSHVDVVGRLPVGVLRYFVQGKLSRLAKEEPLSESCELRLQVPNMNYEFDGGGLADTDLKPRKIDGKYYLITYGTYRLDENRPWTGPHILGKKQVLKVDRDRKGVRTDKAFCRVDLPGKGLVKEGRSLPHPIWVARIKGSDEGERVGSGRWKLMNGVEGLDRTLLG